MELKEYLEILKKNISLFLVIIVLIPLFAWAFFYFQPTSFETSLILNITRTGIQETPDYRYDDFYRLQADERFSDTVVEWIKSPQIVNEIFGDARLNPNEKSITRLKKTFSAERRTSQVISIKFFSNSPEVAEKISSSIVKTLSEKTQKLNENQKEPNWFQIVAEKPLITRKAYEWEKIILAALLSGIFVAFFAVMGKHYWK